MYRKLGRTCLTLTARKRTKTILQIPKTSLNIINNENILEEKITAYGAQGSISSYALIMAPRRSLGATRPTLN